MEDNARSRPPRESSVVDELLGRTRQFLSGMIADYVKRSVDDILQWVLGRAARYAVSTALFIMAAGFVLWGGAESLVISGVPPHLAHLGIGAAALLAGLVVLKCYPRPSERP